MNNNQTDIFKYEIYLNVSLSDTSADEIANF